jgi:hypothetical protein
MSQIKIDLSGLERLQRRAAALHGTHQVPINQVLTAGFMQRHSSFSTFQAMLDSSPFAGMDFDAIPDAEWDVYVRQATPFASWQEMLKDAAADWVKKQLVR